MAGQAQEQETQEQEQEAQEQKEEVQEQDIQEVQEQDFQEVQEQDIEEQEVEEPVLDPVQEVWSSLWPERECSQPGISAHDSLCEKFWLCKEAHTGLQVIY